MEERKKVRVAIQQNNKQSENHPYEKVLTPKSKKVTLSRLSLWTIVKSAFLALIVGAVFGISMLLFLDISTPGTSQGQDNPIPTATEEDDEDSSTEQNSEKSSIDYAGGQYDVFQLGVFSTQDNAETHQTSIATIPSVVIPQGERFYLLTGLVHDSIDQSTIESYLESRDLTENDDYYVTAWDFEAGTITANDDQSTWLDNGQHLINGTNLNAEWEEELTDWLRQYPQTMEDNPYVNELINLTTQDYQDNSQALLSRATMLLTLNLLFESIS